MKLSIISVNYKAWGYLEKALDSLRPGFPEDWEIIIVDNETDPTTFEDFRERYPWVTMVANADNSGFGFGCIIGVGHASGDRLLFMNPDVIATCDDIHALIEVKAAHPEVALLSPSQVGKDGRPKKVSDAFPTLLNQSKTLKILQRLFVNGRKSNRRAEHGELVYCDWVTGSFLLVDRADYDAIGGWSPDYWMYAEDADLCKRAHDLGMRVAYTPKIQVMHAHGGSSRINIDIKAMTKLEVIISKHVYAHNHARGLMRGLTHALIIVLRLSGLAIAALADLLTLGRVPTLTVRRKMLGGLVRYYRGAIRRGSWLSPRALANQRAQA